MSTEDSQLLQNLPPELWNRMQTMVLAMLQEQKPAMVAPIATNTVDQSLSDSVDQSPVMLITSPPPPSLEELVPGMHIVSKSLPGSVGSAPDTKDHPHEVLDPAKGLDENGYDLEALPVIATSPPRQPASTAGNHKEPPQLIIDLDDYDYTRGEPLDAPPVCLFRSMDKLVQFCQAWAKSHGYAVCKSNLSPGKNVYIRCDRSGDYHGLGSNPSGQQTASIKINCPFLVYGSPSTSEKVTNKSWKMQLCCVDHNHEASPSPASHAAHRLLIPAQIAEIQRLWKLNLRPAQILLQLQTADPNILATNKTILNALQKLRREDPAGRSPIEVLMTILKGTNWASEVKVDHEDATYKTNQYQIPLLHIIGQTSTNGSFSVGFCLLTREDDASYLWAVECLQRHVWRNERAPKVFLTNRKAALRKALKAVYPDSQAHLTKNIKTHFTGPKVLDSSGEWVHPWDWFLSLWKQVAYLKTPDIYVERYNILKDFLKTKAPGVDYTPALNYIEKNIIPMKELFVVAWLCQYPHLRDLDISRVESGHAYLKTFIRNSTGDLLNVLNSLCLAVDAQIKSVHESIGKDTTKKLVNVPKVFIPLLGQVSTFAIQQCKAQYHRLTKIFDPTKACSQTLTKGVGIPCAHRIAELLETGEGLEPEDFDLQWHLKYNPESLEPNEEELDLHEEIHKLTILLSDEPPSNLAKLFEQFYQIAAGTHASVQIKAPNVKRNPKGRPSSKKAASTTTSTTKNPLAFEIVEAKTEKAQKLIDAEVKKTQKANELNKRPRPTKKRVSRAGSGSGRRSKQTKKTAPSNEVGGNKEDGEGEGSDLPDLPETAVGPSPEKVAREVPVKEETQSPGKTEAENPGKTEGEKEENGSSYGKRWIATLCWLYWMKRLMWL
ncbi:hypothetical protein MJO28_003401 [Puccinia striiformis f. sp. tritici]|uniref:Uncharacterized protein n=1 Tax=Puccinia striiformis f. sp. tritici TaxID=168172 RepID=A0ACC0EUT7_9BASI|nr:hypothetical protein MJO28_003401 [Puccinia striiformis f. sp. tritici]